MSHNWKNILVSPAATIQEVLKIINGEALQLALVVDTENRLLGTVTDGDIRRALISELPLTHPISEIMFTSPTVVDSSISRAQILALMNAKHLHSIPIIDDGVVVGLETIHHVTQKTKYDNPVFLMAGGFGTRLKPLTDNCPKPLLKVGDKPILETVLLQFIKSGFYNFYISTHYLPEMIEEHFGDGSKWGVTINYVHEDQPLGTGGALGLLPKDLPDLPVIMMNGDVLTKVDLEALLAFHDENNADATMCVREYEYQVPFGVIESEGKNIKSMVEKPIQRFHVNAGIYVVGREIVDSVKENELVDMPTLLERYLNKQVLKYPFYEYWLDIGRMADFERAQQDYASLRM
ncbi:MAG: CBS domain-containing protein [Colwellia sp.]|uniref:nucleotidyltransferase family protein n=1 Tax=Alteromonadales TaxID=135622 RepID=UPI001D7D9B0E|nr:MULTISPECIES: nucleotidyltransferase family protein [Alteromonadales]NQZ26995.1 CBS domain-containing protein [Colwellia sp.]NRA78652.1 CBS domain-containing protein [Pseudoalteromonas sp.]